MGCCMLPTGTGERLVSSSLRSIHVAPRHENTGLAALTILTKLFRYNSDIKLKSLVWAVRRGVGRSQTRRPRSRIPFEPTALLFHVALSACGVFLGYRYGCSLGAVAEAQSSQPLTNPSPKLGSSINGALNGAPASVRIRNQTSGVRTLISQPDARRRDDCARVRVAEKR